jgi:MFS family permease
MGNRSPVPRWLIATLILLCLSVFINYIDRGNLSTAAPLIKGELNITATQLGLLLTAFFITYAAGHFVAGWLVDRFEAFRMLLIGFLIWSGATILTGFAQGFAALFALRLVLGGGESFAFPAYSRIICRCFPEEQRGIANGSIVASMALGPAFGIFFGGILMGTYGWRAFFIGFGLLSLAWILPWIAFGRKCSTVRPTATNSGPSLRDIARTSSLWGTVVAAIGQVYTWYFILTWIPFYLVQERHWSMSGMAVIGGGAYLLTAISMMTSGWVADRWIRSGASPTLARKTFLCGGGIGVAIFTVSCVLANTTLSIACLMVAGLFYGMVVPNAFAAVQTLAGSEATGRWVGIWNGLASLSGIVAPALTGFLVDRTGNFVWPFLVAGGMALVGSSAWLFLVGPITEIDWSRRTVTVPLAASPRRA